MTHPLDIRTERLLALCAGFVSGLLTGGVIGYTRRRWVVTGSRGLSLPPFELFREGIVGFRGPVHQALPQGAGGLRLAAHG